jgi:catechol 2,3-dioxygenase-like lactoylglutathione lyase family enzyme
MLRIYRIDHVAVATPDLDKHARLFEGLFGFRRTHTWDNPLAGVRGVRLEVPGAWGQCWVLLEPSGDGSLQGWLDEHGGRAGLHHVGAEVPDLDAAVAELEGRGLKITDSVPGNWVEASLSPPEHGPGVLWRLRGPGNLAMLGDEDAVTAAPTPAEGPSLGILGIDHICQAFHDRDELARWYTELAGFVQVWRTAEDEIPDMADLVLNIPGSSICWEVITGRGEDSFVDKFLARSGAAAHHVTFQVADWDAALAACAAHDIPTFDDEEGVKDGAAWKHTFIHPKHAGGVLVQLFWEERPGVWVRSDKIPPPTA